MPKRSTDTIAAVRTSVRKEGSWYRWTVQDFGETVQSGREATKANAQCMAKLHKRNYQDSIKRGNKKLQEANEDWKGRFLYGIGKGEK